MLGRHRIGNVYSLITLPELIDLPKPIFLSIRNHLFYMGSSSFRLQLMPNPKFSEFQFAYSVTRELEKRRFGISLFGLPWFPTQNVEADVGFDVAFPNGGISPLCLQYKRSKRLDDARARDEEWDVYQGTYYRFGIRTANKTGTKTTDQQHEILVDLANDCPHTYYVAPEFIKLSQYAQLAQTDQVTENAVFIACQGAPKPNDDEKHVICHRPRDDIALLFSETPSDHELSVIRGAENLLAMIYEEGPQFRNEQELRNAFRSLRSRIIEQGAFDINPEEYAGESARDWMNMQQRFFMETIGVMLYFVFHFPIEFVNDVTDHTNQK